MSAVVALILISVSIFVVGIIGNVTDTEVDLSYSGSFPIEDPDIDQVCDTDRYEMTGIIVVQVMNDGSTRVVSNANFTYVGDIVTVDNEVIWG